MHLHRLATRVGAPAPMPAPLSHWSSAICQSLDSSLRANTSLRSIGNNKMTYRWSQSKTLRFVQLYRDYENLWNVYHPEYRDRTARLASMQAIVEEMNLPNFTIKDVPKKIKALRSTYYLELAKAEKMKANSGDKFVYKPSLLWYDAMSYIIECSHIKDEDSCNNSPNKMIIESPDSSKVIEQELSDDSPKPQQPLSRIPDARVFFYGDVNQVAATSNRPNVVRTHHSSSDRFRAQQKRRIVTTTDVVKELRDLKEQLRSSTTAVAKEEDECDIMGKHISYQLRELPVQERVRANFEIQKILMDYRLRNIESMSASHSSDLEPAQ